MSATTPEHIIKLGTGFWGSKTLLSAIELGVFSALAGAPADLPTLQKKLGLHQRSARDFLDALVALRMLEREDGVYRNTADTTSSSTVPSHPTWAACWRCVLSGCMAFGGSLTEALRTGEPQNEAKEGRDFFGALYAEPRRLREFLGAMSGLSAGAAQAIAAKFPWRDYTTFVDVGAAQGILPVTLARAHAHLRGIGFDLPPVQPVFEEFVANHGLSDRVRF
jgi:hypothetical protein